MNGPTSAVHKYPVQFGDSEMPIPAGAEILHFGFIPAGPTVWVRIEPGAPMQPHRFRLVRTGEPIENETTGGYVGTASDAAGFVWHLFERLP